MPDEELISTNFPHMWLWNRICAEKHHWIFDLIVSVLTAWRILRKSLIRILVLTRVVMTLHIQNQDRNPNPLPVCSVVLPGQKMTTKKTQCFFPQRRKAMSNLFKIIPSVWILRALQGKSDGGESWLLKNYWGSLGIAGGFNQTLYWWATLQIWC